MDTDPPWGKQGEEEKVNINLWGESMILGTPREGMSQKVRRNPKTMTGFADVRDRESERWKSFSHKIKELHFCKHTPLIVSSEESLVAETQSFCGFAILLNKGHDVMRNL